MKVLCFLTLLFWMQFAYAQRINFKTIGNHMIAEQKLLWIQAVQQPS